MFSALFEHHVQQAREKKYVHPGYKHEQLRKYNRQTHPGSEIRNEHECKITGGVVLPKSRFSAIDCKRSDKC
jgi:hypothetical protein